MLFYSSSVLFIVLFSSMDDATILINDLAKEKETGDSREELIYDGRLGRFVAEPGHSEGFRPESEFSYSNRVSQFLTGLKEREGEMEGFPYPENNEDSDSDEMENFNNDEKIIEGTTARKIVTNETIIEKKVVSKGASRPREKGKNEGSSFRTTGVISATDRGGAGGGVKAGECLKIFKTTTRKSVAGRKPPTIDRWQRSTEGLGNDLFWEGTEERGSMTPLNPFEGKRRRRPFSLLFPTTTQDIEENPPEADDQADSEPIREPTTSEAEMEAEEGEDEGPLSSEVVDEESPLEWTTLSEIMVQDQEDDVIMSDDSDKRESNQPSHRNLNAQKPMEVWILRWTQLGGNQPSPRTSSKQRSVCVLVKHTDLIKKNLLTNTLDEDDSWNDFMEQGYTRNKGKRKMKEKVK